MPEVSMIDIDILQFRRAIAKCKELQSPENLDKTIRDFKNDLEYIAGALSMAVSDINILGERLTKEVTKNYIYEDVKFYIDDTPVSVKEFIEKKLLQKENEKCSK